jgi:hypothetical protein
MSTTGTCVYIKEARKQARETEKDKGMRESTLARTTREQLGLRK